MIPLAETLQRLGPAQVQPESCHSQEDDIVYEAIGTKTYMTRRSESTGGSYGFGDLVALLGVSIWASK